MPADSEIHQALVDLAKAVSQWTDGSVRTAEFERMLEDFAYLRLDRPVRRYFDPKQMWDVRQQRLRPVTTIYLPGDEP